MDKKIENNEDNLLEDSLNELEQQLNIKLNEKNIVDNQSPKEVNLLQEDFYAN